MLLLRWVTSFWRVFPMLWTMNFGVIHTFVTYFFQQNFYGARWGLIKILQDLLQDWLTTWVEVILNGIVVWWVMVNPNPSLQCRAAAWAAAVGYYLNEFTRKTFLLYMCVVCTLCSSIEEASGDSCMKERTVGWNLKKVRFRKVALFAKMKFIFFWKKKSNRAATQLQMGFVAWRKNCNKNVNFLVFEATFGQPLVVP